jgi:hypothetical protein
LLEGAGVVLGGKRDKEQNKKVKVTLERAMKAQRGVEIKLYSFFNLSGRWR